MLPLSSTHLEHHTAITIFEVQQNWTSGTNLVPANMDTHLPMRDSVSPSRAHGAGDVEIQKSKAVEEIEKYAQKTIDFYWNLFKAIGLASTLGASITFSVIFQQLNPAVPKENGNPMSYNRSQALAGISWVLFIATLGFAGFSLGLVQYTKVKLTKANIQHKTHWFEKVAPLASFLVQGLLSAAFVTSSLAFTAYTSAAGYVGVGLIGFFTLVAFVFWAYHYR